MAKRKVSKLDLEKLLKKSKEKPKTYDPTKQVEGYKRRLEASGIDPEKAIDTRNWFEKALNLTPDQNALFDFFELMERPQQALFGGIDAAQNGGDFMEGMQQGWTGNKDTRFGQILRNYGMEDSGEAIGADDVLGFIGDVLLDPMDLALIPVTAGASVAVKGALKGADTAIDAAQAAQKATKLVSGTDLVMKGVKGAVKTTAKTSDNILKGILKKIDTWDVAKIKKLGLENVAKELKLLQKYDNAKLAVSKAFNIISSIPAQLMEKARRVMGAEAVSKVELRFIKSDFDKKLPELAKKAGYSNVDDAGRDLMAFLEWKNYKPETTVLDLVGASNMDKIPITEEAYKLILDVNDTFKLGYKPTDLFEEVILDNGVKVWYANPNMQQDFAKSLKDLEGVQDSFDEYRKSVKTVDHDPQYYNKQADMTHADSQYEVRQVLSSVDDQGLIDDDVVNKYGTKDATPDVVRNEIEANGGVTVINGKVINADKGFNVAYDKKKELPFDNIEDLQKYADDNNITSYGVWLNDDGKYVLDATSTFTYDSDIAAKLGYFGNQDTIFDWSDKNAYTVPEFMAKYNLKQIVPSSKNTTVRDLLYKLAGSKIASPRYYSPEDIAKFNRLAQSKDFIDMANYTEEVLKKMYSTIDYAFSDIDELTGLTKLDDAGNPVGATTKLHTAFDSGAYHHATTDEYKELGRKIRDARSHSPMKSDFRGNINTFSGREYKMSAQEANLIARTHQSRLANFGTTAQKEFWSNNQNIQLFQETIQANMDDFIDVSPKFAKNARMIDELLVRGWMEDPDILRGLADGEVVPVGYKKVSKSSLESKLRGYAGYVSDSSAEAFNKTIKNLPDTTNLIIDNNVYDLIGRLDDTKSVNMLVRMLDTVNNAFKRFKLLSPGFQMRNILGNATNMYVAGVPVAEIPTYLGKAHNIMDKGVAIMEKVTLDRKAYDLLSDADKEIYRLYTKFVRNNFHDVAEELWEIPAKLRNKVHKTPILDDIQQFNNKCNNAADVRFRMAAMMYAEKHPEVYQKLGLNSDVAFVRHALFDPKDLTPAEKEFGKRLIPFYTFIKKNLAFQMKNLTDNPVRYKRIKKGIQSMWEAIDIKPEQLEAYKRENFWFPLITEKNGKYLAVKASLPIGDLGEFIENPLGKVVSSVSPGVRAPFELALNKQAYTGLPIQEFEGQKGYNIPELTRKQEYLLSQTGLDVPYIFGKDVATGIGQLAKTGDVGGALKTMVGRSALSSGDINRAATSRAYEELNQLRELMKYYKQENINILTLAEAENKNPKLNAVSAALAKLR